MIRIITDSTADMRPEDAKKLGLTIVPLNVMFGDEAFKDGVDLTNKEFYEKMASSANLPTTSQPSPEEFITHFEDAKQKGDEVICITLSSAISGTYQSACIAKDEVDYDGIHVVDSKNATVAEGLLVELAVSLANKGMSAGEIVEDLLKARESLHMFAIVDNLTNLRKGGRLSGAAAIAGSVLGIKPVIAVNPTLPSEGENTGAVSVAGKARGLPGAYLHIFKAIEEMGGVSKKFPEVRLAYAGDKSSAVPFVQFFDNKLNIKTGEPNEIGAVIGTHVGSGAVGIGFFDAEY